MNAVAWFDSFPAPDRWRDLAHAHGPKIATWTLALLLGVQAALILTDLTGGASVPAATKSAAGGSKRPAMQQRINVAAIANGHLFGAQGATASAADAANAPQTSMPLVLTGIIAGDDPATGLAILGESASSAKVYGVGDAVPGGAKLHSVYSDRVLLDRNGSVESLSLPRQYAGGGPAAPLPGPPPLSENPVLDRMRRLIADQPGAISDVMRPQPVFAQGKQRGYRVYPGRNRQAFVRLGLRPGDLVTAINGTPLDDPARGQEIFQTLGSASEARVTVMRNGRQQDLTLNIAQVAQQAEQAVGDNGGESADPPAQVPEPPPDDGDGND